MSRGTWQGSGTWQTTGGGGGGGGLVLAVVAAAVLAGSGAASALASAVVTVLIITGSITGLAVLCGIAWIVHRARSERPGRPIAAPVMYQIPPEPQPRLEESHKPAIEPARNELHLHFHGMSPAEAAEAIRQASGGR